MKKSYQEIAKKNSPKENVIANAVVAFISGGIMGIIGQFLIDTYSAWLDIPTKEATVCMLVTLIFFSCLFTSLGFFDKWVNFCKCGLIIPITGFANSIVSPSMEYKSEGYIMGVGGKMFTVAGPVLVFGISTSIIVGLIYMIFNTQSITLV